LEQQTSLTNYKQTSTVLYHKRAVCVLPVVAPLEFAPKQNPRPNSRPKRPTSSHSSHSTNFARLTASSEHRLAVSSATISSIQLTHTYTHRHLASSHTTQDARRPVRFHQLLLPLVISVGRTPAYITLEQSERPRSILCTANTHTLGSERI